MDTAKQNTDTTELEKSFRNLLSTILHHQENILTKDGLAPATPWNAEKRKQARTTYLQKRGLELPEDDTQRLLKARTLLLDDRNYEAFLQMTSPEIDCDRPAFTFMCAHAYGDPLDHRFYNPQKSLAMYLAFEQLFGCDASSRIAASYAEGKAGKIDLNAAIYWYQKSIERGNDDAEIPLATLYKNHDPRYGRDDEAAFTAYVDALDGTAITSLTSARAQYQAAQAYANGKGVAQNDARTIEAYKNVMALDPDLRGIGAIALQCLATRTFLGLGTPADFERVQALSAQYNGDTSYCAGMRYNTLTHLDRLNNLIEIAKKEGEKCTTCMADYFKNIYEGKFLFEDTLDILGNMEEPVADLAEGMAWAYTQLAGYEKWATKPAWDEILKTIRANKIKMPMVAVNRSTIRFGPVYNQMDAQGLPVLGALLDAASTIEERLEAEANFGAFTPTPGARIFLGLQADAMGDIAFKFAHSDEKPGLILQQDVDVVMALAFGDEQPIWPQFSLEDAKDEIDDPYDIFSIKQWNPAWLAHTYLGHTLYTTDILAAALAWDSKKLAVASETDRLSKQGINIANSLLDDLTLSGGSCAGHSTGRVMLRPENVPITVYLHQTFLLRDIWEVHAGQAKMMLDGAFIGNTHGSTAEDREIALNDPRYSHGRAAATFTRHFNDIAALVPVFERARQLMGMVYATAQLRNTPGFTPHPALLESSRAKLEHFKKRTDEDNSPTSRVCRRLPLTYGV